MFGTVRRDASLAVDSPQQLGPEDYPCSGPETFLPAAPQARRRRGHTRNMAVASAVGGAAEGGLTSWLRVATIERQLMTNPPPLLQHVRQLGPQTLSRGMGLYTVSTALANLWCFTLQQVVQRHLHPHPGPVPASMAAIAGAIAGVSEAVLTNPVRTLMVAMANPKYRGQTPVRVARTLLKEQGPAAFTRGVGAGAMRNALGCALFFPLVAALRDAERPNAGRDLAAGAAAGALVAALVTPLDTIVAAMQSQTGAQAALTATVQGLWQRGGVAPFYNGVSTTAARAALATGISFVTTMQVLKALGDEEKGARHLYEKEA